MKQFWIGLDQWIGTWFGGMADETISARCWRMKDKNMCWAIARSCVDWLALTLFNDVNHCENSYKSELNGTQLPADYKNHNGS